MKSKARVFLNDSFIAPEDACIPVMDRGFLFGDGVYEVIPVYGGRLFRLDQHLQRLDDSLRAIRIRNPHSNQEWTSILQELIDQEPGVDQSVYLQVTRGVDTHRDHSFSDQCKPTVFIMGTPVHSASPDTTANGESAITLRDIRWDYCNIKAITLLPNVLLRQQAIDAGAVEAILLRDGWATEGAASNLFIVQNKVLITPPTGPRLLPGITRNLIIELAAENSIPYRETDILEHDLRNAEEIWLTSSTKEIVPVTDLDGVMVGDGKPGELYHRMMALYRDYKEALRNGTVS